MLSAVLAFTTPLIICCYRYFGVMAKKSLYIKGGVGEVLPSFIYRSGDLYFVGRHTLAAYWAFRMLPRRPAAAGQFSGDWSAPRCLASPGLLASSTAPLGARPQRRGCRNRGPPARGAPAF